MRHPSNSSSEHSARPLIFLHLPKTAGVTLNAILWRFFGEDETYRVYGIDPSARVKAFQQLPLEKRAEYQLITGHMAYGIHESLAGPANYMTILRDPVQRFLSEYYYIRSHSAHWMHETLVSKKMTIEDLAKSECHTILNAQTVLLAGVISGDKPEQEDVDKALERLRSRIAVVGLNERFDEFLVQCSRLFGWRNIYYTKANVTRGRQSRWPVTDEQRSLIESACRFDVALYQEARRLVEKRIRDEGIQFRHAVRRFRIVNSCYQKGMKARQCWRTLKSSMQRAGGRREP